MPWKLLIRPIQPCGILRPVQTARSSSSAAAISPVVATAPAYPRGQLVLHTTIPDKDWPRDVSDLPGAGEIHRQVCDLGLEGVGVGFSYDAERDRVDGSSLRATLYTPSIHEVPFDITLDSLSRLRQYIAQPPTPTASDVHHIYVCTHGSRDCRCGDLGGALFERLEYEAKRRRLSNVSVRRIAHIGGHKYAANAILYPSGDWLGLLKPEDAPTVIDAALQNDTWWTRWRGRTGLEGSEMKALHEAATLQPEADANTLARAIRRDKRPPQTALGDEVAIIFERYDGSTVLGRGFEGETLKDLAKRHELVEATCGGACECATCAVDLIGAALPGDIPPVSEEELDQLEFAISRNDATRLACQIPLTKQVGEWTARGGKVKLPRF